MTPLETIEAATRYITDSLHMPGLRIKAHRLYTARDHGTLVDLMYLGTYAVVFLEDGRFLEMADHLGTACYSLRQYARRREYMAKLAWGEEDYD